MNSKLLLLLVFVLSSTTCQKTVGSSEEQNNNPNQARRRDAVNFEAGKIFDETKPNAKPQKSKHDSTENELKNALPALLGNDFLLIKSEKPPFLIGDFNGDGNDDAALVVGAQDRYGKSGELVNPFENLCFLSVDVSFQNIVKNSFVPARPRQNCGDIEKQKSRLEPKESNYGLFVVFGDANGLQSISQSGEAFGRKFLLLDAAYPKEGVEKVVLNSKDGTAAKIKNCVPSGIKSDVIAASNADGGTTAIYFDGKRFNGKQCGD